MDEASCEALSKQQSRNQALVANDDIRKSLQPFLQPPPLQPNPPVTQVVLLLSPYPNRRATILFSAVDKPCDYPGAVPADLSSTSLADVVVYPKPFGTSSRLPFFRTKVIDLSPDANSKGPYSQLTYVLGESAVPFTALLTTLAASGVAAMPHRRGLLDRSWSMRWIKHPLPSDFAQVRAASFQKLNHFPGSARLGRKDGLHQLLNAAVDCIAAEHLSGACVWKKYFPQGYLIPQDNDALFDVLRDTADDKVFIVKPTTAACGRGISVCRWEGLLTILRDRSATRMDGGIASETPEPNASILADLVVQEYVSRPFLAYGYKFDLRLYVVVTSYEPLRVYLYDEGLVRFATSPYYAQQVTEADGNGVLAPLFDCTSHLTNFTINKKSEDFVAPVAEDGECTQKTTSKWSLSTLATYVEQRGFSWSSTWDAIQRLISFVFLSACPHVRRAMREVVSTSPATSQLHSHGVCPYFEFYGVDVILREPESVSAEGGANSPIRPALDPAVLEVNIMPSLSTHYSPLDQRIKANFIADALTLVGLTSTKVKSPPPTRTPDSYEHQYLRQLPTPSHVEACITAHEEWMRASHFSRAFPSLSLRPEEMLLLRQGVKEIDASEVMLEETLCEWFRWLQNHPDEPNEE